MTGPVVIAAVGDLQLGDSVTTPGFGFASRYADTELDVVFADLRPAFGAAHVVFANLETTLSRGGVSQTSLESLQMRGWPRYASDLRRAGFTILNVANNHAVQHGAGAFDTTIALLRAAGIAVCGLRGKAPWAAEPAILETAAGRVGVLGYCHRPRQYAPGSTPPYAEASLDDIVGDVVRLRQQVPVVVVSLHWGEEFVSHPSSAEVAAAHRLVEAGAALLLGHHPHVARPVEVHGRGVIAYSLGNCVADMVWQERLRRGTLVVCEVGPDGTRVRSATGTRIDRAYIPRVRPGVVPVVGASQPLVGQGEESYRRAVARSVRLQRLASYLYTVANAWRMPPKLLWQLVRRTVKNRMGWGRVARSDQG